MGRIAVRCACMLPSRVMFSLAGMLQPRCVCMCPALTCLPRVPDSASLQATRGWLCLALDSRKSIIKRSEPQLLGRDWRSLMSRLIHLAAAARLTVKTGRTVEQNSVVVVVTADRVVPLAHQAVVQSPVLRLLQSRCLRVRMVVVVVTASALCQLLPHQRLLAPVQLHQGSAHPSSQQ